MASKCLTDDSIKLYYQALADVFTSSSCEENSSSSSSDISSDVKDTAPEETTELRILQYHLTSCEHYRQ